MKRMMTWILVMLALGTLANAGQLAVQNARIRQGIRNGTLTRGEAVRLRANQRRVRRQMRRQNRRITRLNQNGRNRTF